MIPITRLPPSSTDSSLAPFVFPSPFSLDFWLLVFEIILVKNLAARGAARGLPMAGEWEKLYQAAILETDWSKIEGRIQVAESAIKARLHEFSLNHGGTPEENQAVKDALAGLTVLRHEVAEHAKKPQNS